MIATWVFIIAAACLGLGYIIGRLQTSNERTEREIKELEAMREHWRPVLQSANEQINRINAGAS